MLPERGCFFKMGGLLLLLKHKISNVIFHFQVEYIMDRDGI